TPGVNSWLVSVNWGDGARTDFFFVAAQGSLGTRQHTFMEEGTYTVTVTVVDTLGDSDRTTFQVNVADQQISTPAVTAPTGVLEGMATPSTTFLATFTDPAGVGAESLA